MLVGTGDFVLGLLCFFSPWCRRCTTSRPPIVSPAWNQCSMFTDPDALCCTDQATRPGDKLLDDGGCVRCSPETGGVGAAAVELVRMVDVRRDRGVSGSTLSVVSVATAGWFMPLCCRSTLFLAHSFCKLSSPLRLQGLSFTNNAQNRYLWQVPIPVCPGMLATHVKNHIMFVCSLVFF